MAVNKKVGKLSQGANDFLKPYAPTIGTATDVGTGRAYNDGAATVTFTAAGPNAATSYTVTAVEDPSKTASGASSPITVTGLASGTNYTFKVTGTNSYGTGDASSASNQITATTVPQAPTIGAVTNTPSGRAYNNGLVTVAFTAGATGGKAITGYTALSSGAHTGTGASSPISVTGLASATSYTFTVKATNANGDSAYSSASSSVTATTAPAAPSAPTVTTAAVGGSAAQGSANTANDTVSWSAPANGGSAITNYYWASSDGKSGNTTSTSVVVAQESGTAQTYTVRADNANGSATSSPSASITSAFSFTPFSVFSFSPFGVFGFSPFGVFGFSPFGVFGFSPFSVFGFSPFSVFGFSPFAFAPYFKGSLSPSTKVVMADGSLKESVEIQVGDTLKSAIIPGLETNFTKENVMNWIANNDLNSLEIVETTVTSVTEYTAPVFVSVNGDGFSGSHLLLTNRDGEVRMRFAEDLLESDLVWSTESNTWTNILALEKISYSNNVIGINCEPYDVFFTEKTLTHDGYDEKLN